MAKLLYGIKIDKIGYGGIGLARMSDGKRILIKGGALPGSVVDLRIVKTRNDFVEAHITKIHTQDASLIDGKIFCNHFFWSGEEEEKNTEEDKKNLHHSKFKIQHSTLPHKVGCGGCKWQMLSYPTQLKLKHDIVLDAFQKLKNPELPILPIVGSPLEKAYRNKIEFSFGKYITNSEGGAINAAGKKEITTLSDWSVGFHKQGEFSKIVDIDICGLISDKANTVFHHLKSLCLASGLPVYDQKTHQGFFRHLVIREGTHTQQLLVNLSVSEDQLDTKLRAQRDQLLQTLEQDTFLRQEISTLVITSNMGLADTVKSQDSQTRTFRGEGHIYEKLIIKQAATTGDNMQQSETMFRVSPFSFFQTNTFGAETLFGLAMEMVGQVEGNILDLYCGTGSIGISFLKAGKGDHLIGIEIVEEAITDAWHNAKINGLEKQVLFVADAAEKALTNNNELKAKIKDLGLVIVDPPRDGLHKSVITFLGNLKKEYDIPLLYISCNPVTMVRDIQLLEGEGFSIKTVQPVDMFPQTHHIECIGILK